MIMVTASVNAKPGMETKVRELTSSLVKPSMSESGCLDIRLNEAVDKPGSFVFITRWKAESDFDRHLNMPYVKAFLDKVPTLLVTPPEVKRWTVIAPL